MAGFVDVLTRQVAARIREYRFGGSDYYENKNSMWQQLRVLLFVQADLSKTADQPNDDACVPVTPL